MDAADYPVILTYHSISEGQLPTQIAAGLFTEQMEWLHANARVAPLAEIVSALAKSTALPKRTVALTFDDGYRDFYSSAAPVLQRLKMAATIFLPTGFCDGGAGRGIAHGDPIRRCSTGRKLPILRARDLSSAATASATPT